MANLGQHQKTDLKTVNCQHQWLNNQKRKLLPVQTGKIKYMGLI